ncbi:MAG: tellurium resistance protein TerA [Methylococcaceae bacterium]|nr:tellurium resistance protein TerA [Methylococcaceae bacterium]
MATKTLIPGANHPIPRDILTITVQLSPLTVSGAEVDISAFLLNASGKVRGDDDMVFYGQPRPGKGEVALSDSGVGEATFTVNLPQLSADVEKIAFTATIHENKKSFAAFTSLIVKVQDATGECLLAAVLPATGMIESALILGEVYLRQGQWKFRAVGQGFTGGLRPLAEHFGVEVSDAPVVQSIPTPAPSPVSLTKFTLDKSKPTVSLDKKSAGFGEIRINLNWHKGDPSTPKTGLMGGLFGKQTQNVDLDIGCLYEMQNGAMGVIQALGNQFGTLQQVPFIALQKDDRTGASADGEWLHINGQHWHDFKRILIYAFIYQGSPNWAATDSVVTLYVPDEPPLEIRLTEGAKALNTCAIVLLENVAGGLKVNHEVQYFSGQQPMDKHYRWGLNWQAGVKN